MQSTNQLQLASRAINMTTARNMKQQLKLV